jgi:ABC-type histidine transport system ATPase subunit
VGAIKETGGRTMAQEFVVAQDLHKSFNEHKAVDGVSLEISISNFLEN